MGAAPTVVIDHLLPDDAAGELLERVHAFGDHRLYAEHERIELPIGPGLAPRHDAVRNYLRTRARESADAAVSPAQIAARTSYFREEYAYGMRVLLTGIEPFLHHDGLVAAAQQVHGREVVEPAIVYANILLPGQELAVHTDVPEFRGLDRKLVPQWLLVVMLHSGLFERWRLPIATGIAYFGESAGGALVSWPDGPNGSPVRHAPAHNTAVVLDTDTVFHGVELVGDAPAHLPRLELGTALTPIGDREWTVRAPDGGHLSRYRFDELRFSISWKAYCFADEADRTRWTDHEDDLDLDRVLAALRADFVERRPERAEVVDGPQLGVALIDEYIAFPAASPA